MSSDERIFIFKWNKNNETVANFAQSLIGFRQNNNPRSATSLVFTPWLLGPETFDIKIAAIKVGQPEPAAAAALYMAERVDPPDLLR